ncbi:hypothetical protein TNCT_465521, partial [Trichonephila clavata]
MRYKNENVSLCFQQHSIHYLTNYLLSKTENSCLRKTRFLFEGKINQSLPDWRMTEEISSEDSVGCRTSRAERVDAL